MVSASIGIPFMLVHCNFKSSIDDVQSEEEKTSMTNVILSFTSCFTSNSLSIVLAIVFLDNYQI